MNALRDVAIGCVAALLFLLALPIAIVCRIPLDAR